MRQEATKGFTLVEVIVVLAILAILMASAVPALTGYIEKAQNEAFIIEGHSITTALQSTAVELYVTTSNGQITDTSINGYITGEGQTLRTADWTALVSSLNGTEFPPASIFDVTFDGVTLAHYFYMKDTENILEYDKGSYRVLHKLPAATEWSIPAQRAEEMLSALGADLNARFGDSGFNIADPNVLSDPSTLPEAMRVELGIREPPHYHWNLSNYLYYVVSRELGYQDTKYMYNSDSLTGLTFNEDGTIASFNIRWVDLSTQPHRYTTMIEYRNGEYKYVGPSD
jgi:prepilin-type N-terminal cleavage/methylation domain-containing protein